MARKKMWWQDQNDPVKPFVVKLYRQECDCSQDLPVVVSGYSEKQGPTHYCPVCRWAFWPITFKPTAAQVTLEKKTNPDASEKTMSYVRLCNKPGPKWGSTSETAMIDQLGKLQPQFLTASLREYWIRKYCEKYPNCDLAKQRKKLEDEKNKYNRK